MAKTKIILGDSNVLFDYFRGIPTMVQELDELGFDRLYLSTNTALNRCKSVSRLVLLEVL